jgi:micrococcal nuclease
MDILLRTPRIVRRVAAALVAAVITLIVLSGSTEQNVPLKDSQTYEGTYTVVSVIDGDTIRVDVDGTVEPVRFIGINTPEIPLPEKPGECFGTEAKQHTETLFIDKRVRLEVDATQGARDKYHRLLAYPFLPDGTNVGEKLIREGFALERTYAAPYKYQAVFKEAAREAKRETRGLWGACKEGK